jgi:GTPase SAR1 family protein
MQQQDGFKLNMWDIGGQAAIRPYWKNYYERTNGIVFVVDSSDEERMAEAVKEFQELMTTDELA